MPVAGTSEFIVCSCGRFPPTLRALRRHRSARRIGAVTGLLHTGLTTGRSSNPERISAVTSGFQVGEYSIHPTVLLIMGYARSELPKNPLYTNENRCNAPISIALRSRIYDMLTPSYCSSHLQLSARYCSRCAFVFPFLGFALTPAFQRRGLV